MLLSCISAANMSFTGESTGQTSNTVCRFHPRPLLALTTEFVASHLAYVETFAAFPEIVGRDIFDAALRMRQFDDSRTSSLCLEPFTRAYKELVMETLTVRNSGEIVLDRFFQELKLFLHVKQLDLSGCGIHDYHDVVVHVGTQLHRLEVLTLANNSLSDIGIQRLTACSRVMAKGLGHLTHLDLSGNRGITDKVSSYLRRFTRLVTLDLSGCHISEAGKEALYRNLGLTSPRTPPRNAVITTVTNKGWAAPLVDGWLSGTTVDDSRTRSSAGSAAAAKFYSTRDKSLPAASEPTTSTVTESLVFIKLERSIRTLSNEAPPTSLDANPPEYSEDGNDGTVESKPPARGNQILPTVPGLASLRLGGGNGGSRRPAGGGKNSASRENLLACYGRQGEDREGNASISLKRPKSDAESKNKTTTREEDDGDEPGLRRKRRRIKVVGQRDFQIREFGDSVRERLPVETGASDATRKPANKSIFDFLD